MAVISVEKLSEAGNHHRLDAEFYQPQYFIDFSKGKWEPIKKFLDVCQYGISQSMIEEHKGYPIFRMDDIKDCFLLDDEVKYIEIPEQVFKQFKLEINDVLFNRVNAEEFVGRTGIFKLKGDYVFASYLIRLRVKRKSKILPDYLNIFLNTKFGKKQIRRFSRRAVNQANVNAEELMNFKIAVIPIEIQKEISRLSNEAWQKIKLSKSFYSQAENLLLEILGLKDFKPKYELSYTANLSKAYTAHRIDAEHFQVAYDQVIKMILNYQNGYTKLLSCVEDIRPDFDPAKYPNKTFSYIELADVDTSIGIIHSAGEIKGEEAPSRARRILRKDDVIVSSVEGSLEKVALVSKEYEGSLASTGFFQFRPRNILPAVLLVLSKSIVIQMQLKKECAGTILTAVPNESLKKILVPIIPDKTQQKIDSLVQQSHEARRKAKYLLEEAKRKVEEAIENG
ncbi:MAG: restriction endonuclease subunit S [Nitrososphaerota archaeon]